jgi:hypothetical protein
MLFKTQSRSRHDFLSHTGEPLEFDQSLLVRMLFQAEPGKSFPELLEEMLGVGRVLKPTQDRS